MIFICQNTSISSNHKYFIKNDTHQYLLTTNPENENIPSKKIKDLTCEIKTGSIVWNQNKDKLKNETDKTYLIYPDNIVQNDKGQLNAFSLYNIKAREDKVKKQYIDKPSLSVPFLAINRTCGSGKNAKIKIILITQGKYIAENHINVISGELSVLKQIYKSLMNPKTIEYLHNTVGTANLSKTQLENLPLF